MYTELLTFLFLSVNCALSALPYVKYVPCEPQTWPNEQDATQWKCGKQDRHMGFPASEKQNNYKIADFDILLKNMEGTDKAVLCTVYVQGTTIEAFWLNKFSEHFTNTYVFGFGDNVKDKIRLGFRGKKTGAGTLSSRVQLYGYGNKRPDSVTISCGAGQSGNICPGDNLVITPRLQEDVA